jgi:hypothetical protein
MSRSILANRDLPRGMSPRGVDWKRGWVKYRFRRFARKGACKKVDWVAYDNDFLMVA